MKETDILNENLDTEEEEESDEMAAAASYE